jgi:hypothetical protein
VSYKSTNVLIVDDDDEDEEDVTDGGDKAAADPSDAKADANAVSHVPVATTAAATAAAMNTHDNAGTKTSQYLHNNQNGEEHPHSLHNEVSPDSKNLRVTAVSKQMVVVASRRQSNTDAAATVAAAATATAATAVNGSPIDHNHPTTTTTTTTSTSKAVTTIVGREVLVSATSKQQRNVAFAIGKQ